MEALIKMSRKKDISVQDFIDIERITDNGIITALKKSQVSIIIIEPVNIGVLSKSAVESRVMGMQNVIQSILQPNNNTATFSIMAIDSTQSYESNKEYLKKLSEQETIPKLQQLDELDINYLDNIHLSMATSREFMIVLKFYKETTPQQKELYIHKVIQTSSEHLFTVRLADKKRIKKLLAIYYAQANFEEELPDYDGQQFIKEGEHLNEEK